MYKDVKTGKIFSPEDLKKLDELTQDAGANQAALDKITKEIETQNAYADKEINALSKINELMSKAYPEGQLPSDEELAKLLALNERIYTEQLSYGAKADWLTRLQRIMALRMELTIKD